MVLIRAVWSRYVCLNIQPIQSRQLMQNSQMVWRIRLWGRVQEYWLEFNCILCEMIIVMNMKWCQWSTGIWWTEPLPHLDDPICDESQVRQFDNRRDQIPRCHIFLFGRICRSCCHCLSYIVRVILHQQNVKCFGSHNSSTQLFWIATTILAEASRSSRSGWMQNDVLLRDSESTFRCSSMLLEAAEQNTRIF